MLWFQILFYIINIDNFLKNILTRSVTITWHKYLKIGQQCKIAGIFRQKIKNTIGEKTCCNLWAFRKPRGPTAELVFRHNNVCGKRTGSCRALTLCLPPNTEYAKVLTLIAAAGISRLVNSPKIPREVQSFRVARFWVKATPAWLLIDIFVDNDDNDDDDDVNKWQRARDFPFPQRGGGLYAV